MRFKAKFLLAFGGLALTLGCIPPNTQIDLAKIPERASNPDLASAQERVVALAPDQAFTKSLDALMDMGFQVRSASRDAGQINIFRTWIDPSKSNLSIEATLLFRPEGPGSTKIRMLAMGNWQFVDPGGPKSASADVSGLSNLDDPAGYRTFLERLASVVTH